MTRKLGTRSFEAEAAELKTIMDIAHPMARAVSLMQMRAGLRGLWPCAPAGVSGELIDLQGLGNHLTLHGNPQFDSTLTPFVQLDGTGDYFDITDAASSNAFDITGTETFIVSNGIACWAWVIPGETGTVEYVISKWGAAASRAYRLYLDASDQFNFEISDDGTNSDVATSAAITIGEAYFVVGRFEPSSNVEIIVNGVTVAQATARASIFNTATDFAIGADGAGGSPFEGELSLAGVAAAYPSDSWCDLMYQQTRDLFGGV